MRAALSLKCEKVSNFVDDATQFFLKEAGEGHRKTVFLFILKIF